MMFLRRRHARDAAASHSVAQNEGPTEGEVARKRAEKALEREMKRTASVRAETAEYESLGARLLSIYETNHIKADIAKTLRGSS